MASVYYLTNQGKFDNIVIAIDSKFKLTLDKA